MPCFFDIETDGLEDGAQITCAATMTATETLTWHSSLAPYMSIEDLLSLVEYLLRQDLVVTYNGAGFDFKILYFCTQDARVIDLAARHLDICLCFGVDKGYFTTLESFMKGCNIPGKNGSGFSAIELWLKGSAEEKRGILDYCKNDVRCLADLYSLMITPKAKICRVTKRGRHQRWYPKLGLVYKMTEKFREKPPDMSWMNRPPRFDRILDWQYQVPPRLVEAKMELLPEEEVHRCARGSTSIEGFLASIAEAMYAREVATQ